MKILSTLPALTAAAALAGILGSSEPASAQTIADICSNGSLTAAANGTITPVTFSYGGIDRHLCLYESSSIAAGTSVPLVVAMHGHGGNASIMMNDNKRIIEHAETEGWIAAFPNGIPIEPKCGGASPCLDNGWVQPENAFFLAELIREIKAQRDILDDRVHLIGFSGGANLIYRVTGTPGFPHAIHSVATVAGAIGRYTTDTGFLLFPPEAGTSTNAFLVQGGQDVRHPERGGLDSFDAWESLSHLHKVEIWRNATGTDDATGGTTTTVTAQSGVTATEYVNGTSAVTSVVDQNLAHAWPSWDLMAQIVVFFNN